MTEEKNDLAKLVDAVIAAMPAALKRIRQEAGFESLRPAADAIKERTGRTVSKATLSKWEQGRMPQADLLIAFLYGCGRTLHDFQDVLDEEVAQMTDPAAILVEKLRKDPAMRKTLRAALLKGSLPKEMRKNSAVDDLLTILDGMNGDNGDDHTS